MATRQQLEAQLVAAHRSGNVAAAQQAAYAIRQYDQNSLLAQVPTVNAPAVNRPVQPRWDDMLTQFSQGVGAGIKSQLQGVEQIVTQPVESAKALYQAGVEAFRDPAKALGEAWSGIRSTAERAVSSPMGFGQVLGENVNIVRVPGGRRQPTQAELDVYHGTPHTFEPEEGAPLGRFRSSKIGTGEGAQAYGYGLYLAEDPDVADAYRVNLSYDPEKMRIGGKQINEVYSAIERNAARMPPNKAGVEYEKMELLEQLMTNDSLNKVAKRAAEMSPETAKWFEKQVKPTFETYGRNYKVDLPDAKIEQMLDWDKPLSEQPQSVQTAVKKLTLQAQKDAANPSDLYGMATWSDRTARRISPDIVEQMDGAAIHEMLQKVYGKSVSTELSKLGIPGIKYLDAGSRDGGKGTRNFVVFPGEEQNLTILERDGVKAEVPKAAAPKPTTWQGMSRDEFLGNPKITTNRNAADLKPRALTTVVTEQPKPFKGNLTIRMNEDGAAVYDGDKVIASYNFGDTLVVDKKYRKQGIGEELVYQWRKANPTAPPATERTKASQAIQEKVWQRLLNEQG